MKQFILGIIALCLAVPSAGQHRHEISILGGAGLSALEFTPPVGKYKGGVGGNVGLGYYYFFSPDWSIGTGLNFEIYNSKTTFDNYSYKIVEGVLGDPNFEYTYNFSGYEEKVNANMLTIPVKVQFQTPGPMAFYMAVGGKVGIPVNASYEATGNYITRGYSPLTKTKFGEPDGPNLLEYGIGDYSHDQSGDFDLKIAFMLSAELGLKWSFTDALSLYAGVYLDYGLNDIGKNKAATNYPVVVLPQDASAFTYDYTSVISMSNKLHPFAVGGTIRLSFGLKPF